ncbi:unnamed protein product, partial [Adineta ricciae]
TKDQFGFHYVCDEEKNKVRRWKIRGERLDKEGKLVAGGNGERNHLSQLKYPNGIIVDDKGQIYVADGNNHRIMRWCEESREDEIIVGGNREGNKSYQLSYSRGLSFDVQRNLYVADFENHRILRFDLVCE